MIVHDLNNYNTELSNDFSSVKESDLSNVATTTAKPIIIEVENKNQENVKEIVSSISA